MIHRALVVSAAMSAVSIGCAPAADSGVELIDVPGGAFVMGDEDGDANEAPKTVSVARFRLMRHEVTNAEFDAFVNETDYKTDAERARWGYVWDGRWRRLEGADWPHPFGPQSSIAGQGDHPVVQVSANDAAAYCAHYGMRLPTEEEWEFAARGTDGRRYPWGDDSPEASDGTRRANFGAVACCAPDDGDGYAKTAPVGAFSSGASPFGALDMAGNVWEWTASEFPGQPGFVSLRGGGWGNNPYCLRVSYRHANPPDIGLDMVGFRCAADPGQQTAE